MNYHELIIELKDQNNWGRLILFTPSNSQEPLSNPIFYGGGVDSFFIRTEEQVAPMGLHTSLYFGKFEWKQPSLIPPSPRNSFTVYQSTEFCP